MRRILALTALTLLVASPLGTLAQTDSAPPIYYTMIDEGFSSSSTWQAAGTNGTWLLRSDSGRAVAYTARLDNQSQPAGYAAGATTTLTSPVVSTVSHVVNTLELTVRGSSRADDLLRFQARAADGPWNTVHLFSGVGDADAYRTEVIENSSVTSLAGQTVQFRWLFTSASGDSSGDPAADNPEICDTPTPEPLPEEICAGPGPDYLGWFVDAVRLNVRRAFEPAAGQPVTTIPLSATGSGTTTVDLATDSGKFIDLRLDETQASGAEGNVASVGATFVRSGLVGATLALAKSGTLWSTLLAVDEPDLVAGTYEVRFVARTHSGTSILLSRTLAVTSADGTPPLITVAQSGVPIRVGPGQAVEATVTDATLRRVTYQFDGLPSEVELPYPYNLPDTSLPEGPTTLVLRAYDRAGHSSTLSAPVDRDTIAPRLQVALPPQFYDRVPATIELLIDERTPHTVRLDANGTGQEQTSPGGNATHRFTVVPNGTVPLVLRVAVEDAVGNRVDFETVVDVVKPVTDSRALALRVDGPLFAQRPALLVATLDQLGGVTDLPATVAFIAGTTSTAELVTLPRVGTLEVPWNTTLAPGRYTVRVLVTPPTFANETDGSNQNATLDVEVFLGSVYDGDRLLVIRADVRGLPEAALVHGTTRVLPMELVNIEGAGVVYRIELEDGRTLDWDPLSPLAEPPQAATSTADDDDDEDRDAPFPGILVGLALFGLALARRRRA